MPVQPASKRITSMSTDELDEYCQTLREQIRAKRSKLKHLSGDLRRQENILSQAERELNGRSGPTGYGRD